MTSSYYKMNMKGWDSCNFSDHYTRLFNKVFITCTQNGTSPGPLLQKKKTRRNNKSSV